MVTIGFHWKQRESCIIDKEWTETSSVQSYQHSAFYFCWVELLFETMSLKHFWPFCGWILMCSDVSATNFLLCKENMNINMDLSSKKSVGWSALAEIFWIYIGFICMLCHVRQNSITFQTIFCVVQLKCKYFWDKVGARAMSMLLSPTGDCPLSYMQLTLVIPPVLSAYIEKKRRNCF